LIATDTPQTASLAYARRDGARFGAISRIGPLLTLPPECTVGAASLRTVSNAYAVASVETSCSGEARPPPRSVWLLSLSDGSARIREQIALLAADSLGAPGRDVTISMRSSDHDSDGRDDVILDVTFAIEGASEPARIALAWLDRPGGLARDTSEPETTIAALATRARGALRRDPDTALATARKALAIHSGLCREGGAPRLRIGPSDGIVCRTSPGAGQAAAVAAAALARKNQMAEALAALALLDRPGFRVAQRDRDAALRAIEALPPQAGLTWHPGPSLTMGDAPAAHLPAATFVDETTLLLRGQSPSRYDISTGQVTPVDGGDALVRDPSGRLAVADVHRTCDGFALGIVPSARIVSGVVASRPVSEPILERRAPPASVRCPGALPRSVAEDSGGWRVLGWAPQGVVAARGAEARVVPLTVDGRAAGEGAPIEAGSLAPAPLPSGAATPDGSAYAMATQYGVLVHRLGATPRDSWARPAEWGQATGDVTDVAISPSATKVAVVRGGRVYVIGGIR